MTKATTPQDMRLIAQPMDAQAFAPFGKVIDFEREPDFAINAGTCQRYHDLARCVASGEQGQIAISLGRALSVSLPLQLKMVERHPLGTQAFIPLDPVSLVVVVAPDEGGKPGRPLAFQTRAKQGIQYHQGTWHGVFSPLNQGCDVLIIDRVGAGENLEEYFFDQPYQLSLG